MSVRRTGVLCASLLCFGSLAGVSAQDAPTSGAPTPLPALVVEGAKTKKPATKKKVSTKKAPAAAPTLTQEIEPPPSKQSAETATGPVKGLVAKRAGTGTKTDTPIIETPQSVSVVTKDQITDQKAVSVADALAYTPGVVVQSDGYGRIADDILIRGFNVANGNLGMLRDGMKLQSNVYDGGQEPYGLERIDVLRGASSVLYGQLAPGGVVNAISKRPTDEPLHEINVEYGSYNRKQTTFDFSDAVTRGKSFTYRFTGLVREADNWVDYTQDDKVYLAPAFTLRPDADTTLTMLSSYQDVDTRFAPPYQFADVSTGTIPRNLFTGEPDFDRYRGTSYTAGYILDHRFSSDLTLHHSARYFQSDVTWNYMFSNLNAAADTGGDLYRRASARDEASYGITTDTYLEKKFSTGLAEHTVIAGFDSYRRGYDTHRYRSDTFSILNVGDPVYSGYPDVNYAVDRGNDNLGDQYGLYAQDQTKYGNWVFLLGGRRDWSEVSSLNYQSGEQYSQSDEAITGRAGVVYLFDNGIAPYASVSQSFTPQIGLDSISDQPFSPNEGLQYEAGVRYQPVGLNMLMSAAVYDLTQTNVLSYDLFGDARQIGEVQSRGVELEARGQLGAMGYVASYTYTDAVVVESVLGYEIGQQLDLVPKNAFSVWTDYELDEVGIPGLKVGAGVRYIGETNITDSIDYLGTAERVPGYALVDAMARYELGVISRQLEGVALTINARNLFDKEYYTCVTSTGCRYGAPQTVTGTLSYKW